jgi:fimbrial chaperone protein
MMFRSTTSQAVLGLALLILANAALAGSFGVSPIRVTLTLQQPAGMLTVSNQSDEETVVQLQANAWSQQDGADVLEPSSDLIAVPPLFTLAPGGSQVVRVGLRRPPTAKGELTYRLLLREVPPPPAEDFTGLQVALNLSLPVFVLPPGSAQPELRGDLVRTGDGGVELQLANAGDAHVQLQQFALTNPGGSVLNSPALSVYLLPGQSRSWELQAGALSGRWILSARTDAGPVEIELVLD